MSVLVPYSDPGAFGITTELWHCDRYGNRSEQEDPETLGKVVVRFDEDTAPKRTITIDSHDPHAFDSLHDWVTPLVHITDPEGNTVGGPQGLFLVTPPGTTTDAPGSIGQ